MIQLAYDVLDTKGNAVSSCRRFHRTLFDEATIISLFERERERGNKEAERAPSCAENRKIDNSLLYGQKHSFDESKWKGHPAHGKTQRCAIYSKNVARHGVAVLKQKKWILIGSAMNVNEPRVCVLLINLSACNSSDWSIVVEQPSADWWRHGIPVEKWGKREIRKAHDQRRHETKLHETIILLSARSSSSQRLFNR